MAKDAPPNVRSTTFQSQVLQRLLRACVARSCRLRFVAWIEYYHWTSLICLGKLVGLSPLLPATTSRTTL
eukprot:scaffold1054_cov124-Cylindrotheca_fusiformis.AAC.5